MSGYFHPDVMGSWTTANLRFARVYQGTGQKGLIQERLVWASGYWHEGRPSGVSLWNHVHPDSYPMNVLCVYCGTRNYLGNAERARSVTCPSCGGNPIQQGVL